MKRTRDIYNVGNDYDQVKATYFVTADADAEAAAGISGYKAYSDGLYHYTQKPVYELSGGEDALNKRVFNKPQNEWDVSEVDESFSTINDAKYVFSPDYATVDDDITDNDPAKEWKKPQA